MRMSKFWSSYNKFRLMPRSLSQDTLIRKCKYLNSSVLILMWESWSADTMLLSYSIKGNVNIRSASFSTHCIMAVWVKNVIGASVLQRDPLLLGHYAKFLLRVMFSSAFCFKRRATSWKSPFHPPTRLDNASLHSLKNPLIPGFLSPRNMSKDFTRPRAHRLFSLNSKYELSCSLFTRACVK